jgi:hypothetical protein
MSKIKIIDYGPNYRNQTVRYHIVHEGETADLARIGASKQDLVDLLGQICNLLDDDVTEAARLEALEILEAMGKKP